MSGLRWVGALLTVFVLLSAACGDVATQPPLVVDASGDILGLLFLDSNGNGQRDQADTPVRGWAVRALSSNGGVVGSTTSDSLGVFRLLEVPTGRVQLDLDKTHLVDTLVIFGLAVDQSLTLARGDTVIVTAGFTYPKVPLAAVDTLKTGRRVFTEGIALNGLVANGPRELHLRSGARALRITSVVRVPINAGDSVRVLGRRATEANVPILTGGEIFPIRAAVEDPQPIVLTTARAATAADGTLPADLGRVRNADLVQSRNEGNDVVLTVNDGTGPLEILVRSFLGSDASFFNADSVRVQEATGLLAPYVIGAGETRWRLAIRTLTDLRVVREPRLVSARDTL